METATETIGLYSRITMKVMNRGASKTRFSLLRCLLLLLALLCVANGLVGTGQADRGQNFGVGVPLAAERFHGLLPVGCGLAESAILERALPFIYEHG